MQTWTFDNDLRAVAIVPAWSKPNERFPLLIALLGEADQDLGRQTGLTFASNTHARHDLSPDAFLVGISPPRGRIASS